MNVFSRSSFAGLLLLFTGCASTANNNFNSLLWMQTSAEYRANTVQAYNEALRNIDAAVRDRSWTAALEQPGGCQELPPAVVMDIDETVLDNSPYMGKIVLENREWSTASWDEWVARKEAGSVPGAMDFINAVQKKGVRVILISNRACSKRDGSDEPCPQEADTIDNLRKAGMEDVRTENVLLAGEQPGWISEKKSRREAVAKRNRIVMLFGDDLGDFLSGVKTGITPEQREQLVDLHRQRWGKKWYLLPNPTYGSWMSVLGDPKSWYIRSYGSGSPAGSR